MKAEITENRQNRTEENGWRFKFELPGTMWIWYT